MKAKYFKIYASKYLKAEDKEMGFVKFFGDDVIVIYNTANKYNISIYDKYHLIFDKKRCTKKEFEKEFENAINFYKKIAYDEKR